MWLVIKINIKNCYILFDAVFGRGMVVVMGVGRPALHPSPIFIGQSYIKYFTSFLFCLNCSFFCVLLASILAPPKKNCG